MISKLNTKVRPTKAKGLLHDSREDVLRLAKLCNILVDKVNELTDEVNRLKANK